MRSEIRANLRDEFGQKNNRYNALMICQRNHSLMAAWYAPELSSPPLLSTVVSKDIAFCHWPPRTYLSMRGLQSISLIAIPGKEAWRSVSMFVCTQAQAGRHEHGLVTQSDCLVRVHGDSSHWV